MDDDYVQPVQPTRGTLSMKVIRACRVHAQCELECPERTVLDMGVVARFESGNRSWRKRFVEWMEHFSRPEGGQHGVSGSYDR